MSEYSRTQIVSALAVTALAIVFCGWVVMRDDPNAVTAEDRAAYNRQASATKSPKPSATPSAPAVRTLKLTYPLDGMWIGDSLTKGVGASVKANTYQNLMLSELRANGAVNAREAAISGADEGRVIESIATIPTDLELAIIELGTNDATRTPLPEFRTRYNDLISRIREANPQARIICAGTWRPAQEAAPYDPIIESTCEKYRGRYVPLTDLFDRTDTRGPAGLPVYPGESVDPKAKISDTFHPNDLGYQLIADRILSQLNYTS